MITVRKGKQSDNKTIVDFQIRMAKETEHIDLDRDIVDKGVNAVFNNPEKGIYFVAASENKIIASLLITFEWSDWRNGDVYWIHSVYVLPELRKKGVFKTMYLHMKNIVQKDKNIWGLRLYVDKTNINAQKVYEIMGMDCNHYMLFEWMK
ncbi:MAG: GNAT family N-acetyltransferase [Bacteroidales bacterium]|nr:GNAT family N-acetyltransferase [Bacteroidales bacterium]